MLVEVAASRTEVLLQPSPELEGCWCLLRQISEGCALQRGLGSSSVFHGDAAHLEHVVGVTTDNTGHCQGQDLLRKAEKIKKGNFFWTPLPSTHTEEHHQFSKML